MASPSSPRPQFPDSQWSRASSITEDGICATPDTPDTPETPDTPDTLDTPDTPITPSEPPSSPIPSSPPARKPSFSMARARKQIGTTEIEKHKDEILNLYAANTNGFVRTTLQARYGMKITEKQLKRVLRIWHAYKNDRGIRKATIARDQNRVTRRSRGLKAKRSKNAAKVRKRIEHTPSSGSEDDNNDVAIIEDAENVENVHRQRDRLNPVPSTNVSGSNVFGLNQSSHSIPRVQVPPSSPVLSLFGSRPGLQMPTSPTTTFNTLGDGITFNTSTSMPFNTSPHMSFNTSPHMPFNVSPRMPIAPFPSMIPTSPSGMFRNPRDRIAQLFMEAVGRFPYIYKLANAPDKNHWSVYKNLNNVHEQRLRQGILIAQQNEDDGLLDETMETHIVPMYQKLDLLAIVGIVATFASLTSTRLVGAFLYHLRKRIDYVPERHRQNMVAVLNCCRDLLLHHNEDAELFHEDLQSALAGLPKYIQASLGRQSLVGIHLIFLLNLGDVGQIMQEAMSDATGNDYMLRLATSYLLAGKLFFSEGPSSVQTRHHVGLCYKIASQINKMLEKQGVPEDGEQKQDVYHYMLRVGMWQVHCLDRSRLDSSHLAPQPGPPIALLEESILYGERCTEDGPQSPIVIQALGKLVDMYAGMGDYWKAEVTSLRLQAVDARRVANKAVST